mmetsp:Transcript_27353/g.87637  ORF Transcript_27353/g.87637 Transcript_27353/m.87637 type:complete len:235 (+) Transcript_27353:880-1584(+)
MWGTPSAWSAARLVPDRAGNFPRPCTARLGRRPLARPPWSGCSSPARLPRATVPCPSAYAPTTCSLTSTRTLGRPSTRTSPASSTPPTIASSWRWKISVSWAQISWHCKKWTPSGTTSSGGRTWRPLATPACTRARRTLGIPGKGPGKAVRSLLKTKPLRWWRRATCDPARVSPHAPTRAWPSWCRDFPTSRRSWTGSPPWPSWLFSGPARGAAGRGCFAWQTRTSSFIPGQPT